MSIVNPIKMPLVSICVLIVILGSCKLVDTDENIEAELEFINLFDARQDSTIACYRIPSIVTAPNGDLLAAIDERVPSCGDLKWSNDINIVMRISKDQGKSWSDIITIVDYTLGESASDPSMIVDQETGEIFLFYNYMDLNNERDIYYLHYIKSNDNGRSWSEPEDITSQIAKPEWHNDFKFITSGRGIQTSTGKLVHTLVNLNHGMHVFASDDHGVSWYVIDTPVVPGDESKIIELADGSWMINSRANKSGLRYIHTSEDEGISWISRADSTLIDPGCNASILRYSSITNGGDRNRLLFSNANSDSTRTNLTLRISYDEGKIWSSGKTIYEGGSAYSSMTTLPNGDIGIFFEKDDYKENVFVRVSLEWLTDGNDKL